MHKNGFWRLAPWCALVVLVAVGLHNGASGQGQAAARPAMVALVDLQKVINGLEEREHGEQELNSIIAERQAKLKDLGGQYDRGKAELEILAPGSDDYNKKAEELLRLEATLRFEDEFAQTLLNQKRGEVFARLFNKVLEASKRLAEQQGYDLVLSNDGAASVPMRQGESAVRTAMVTRRVLYAADWVDVSAELLRFMNNEWNAGSAAP